MLFGRRTVLTGGLAFGAVANVSPTLSLSLDGGATPDSARSDVQRGSIDYLRRQRHILVDMHVPGFDPAFLRKLDPASNVVLWKRAGADCVMVYCNSMVGLSNWPSKVGQMHPGLAGRDIVGETVSELHKHGIAACAYYSVNYNNWAYENNSSWRVQESSPSSQFGENSRAGLCCPSSQGFRDFMHTQVEEIVDTYEFDAFFFDMMYFPGICICGNCRNRYRMQTGAEIPERIDWFSPEWCRFQKAREGWLLDQYRNLRGAVRTHRPVPVFNNSGFIFSNWSSGISLEIAKADDIIGGDAATGGGLFAFAHLASRLSPNGWQFMHSSSGYASGAVKVPTVAEQLGNALVATSFGGQFMMIDAVLPNGTVYSPAYERLAEVFAAIKPHEQYLGGKPVVDIGVYYSTDANVDFKHNGKSISSGELNSGTGRGRSSDHVAGVWGACEALRRAHLPVGVITRADLEALNDLSVVILPNVLRMDGTEVAAFRQFVDRGGRLYASGYTSLVDTSGIKHADFALADVFGCHFEAPNPALVSFLRPVRDDLRAAVAPATYASHGSLLTGFLPTPSNATALLINAGQGGRPIAKLTNPYREGRGTRKGGFASIFTSPPWEDTDRPVVVEHHYGAGRCVYSACDIEAPVSNQDSDQAQSLFVEIIRGLLPKAPTFEADAHPDVWVVAFSEPEHRRVRVNLFNHPEGDPIPISRIKLRLAPPAREGFIFLRRLPSGEPLDFEIGPDGTLQAEIPSLAIFDTLSAQY